MIGFQNYWCFYLSYRRCLNFGNSKLKEFSNSAGKISLLFNKLEDIEHAVKNKLSITIILKFWTGLCLYQAISFCFISKNLLFFVTLDTLKSVKLFLRLSHPLILFILKVNKVLIKRPILSPQLLILFQ